VHCWRGASGRLRTTTDTTPKTARWAEDQLPSTAPFSGKEPSVRQLIESVNDTLKGQLDLELHGGRTIDGVTARIAQRVLALTAAIWHNRATGQPVTRSLIAYDPVRWIVHKNFCSAWPPPSPCWR
jgi:hypothetical protein